MVTMCVETFLEVALRLPPKTSILIRGEFGIGKSQLVRHISWQLAKLMNRSLPVIDRRLSQVTEGDIIGLPSTDGNVTRFNPPDWFRNACDEPVVLFLDELNRATPEVMQAAFQIVLDRELNGHKLHKDTRVFSAINVGSKYNVNEIDPALLDRFWVIDLEPTVDDWLRWARSPKDEHGGSIAETIVDFIQLNPKFLDPAKDAEPGEVGVSRRSWERLNDALTFAELVDKPEDPLFYSMCVGFIGSAASIKFVDFAKSTEARITGEDVVNKYSKIRRKLITSKKQDAWKNAIDKTRDYVVTLDELTEKQGKNIAAFMRDLTAELRLVMWMLLVREGVKNLKLAKSIHGYIGSDLLDVFDTNKGIKDDVVPNVEETIKKYNLGAK